MDELRTGIGLRGYGQRDPLVEYKQEAYKLFQALLKNIESSVARTIFKVEVQAAPVVTQVRRKPLEYQAPDADRIGEMDQSAVGGQQSAEDQPTANSRPQTGSDVTTTIRQKGKSVYEKMGDYQSGPKSQVKNNDKVGRNDPCPCGATKADGKPKKYKHCCGK